MKSSTKYVDLDVHQATTVATVRDDSGRIIARSILPTEEAALLEFFAQALSAATASRTRRLQVPIPPRAPSRC